MTNALTLLFPVFPKTLTDEREDLEKLNPSPKVACLEVEKMGSEP